MGFVRANGIVGQSGGPTAAINASLSGVIRGAFGKINKLYGMENGISGLIEDRIVDLSCLFNNEKALSDLELTPSAALGSCRLKLPKDFGSPIYERIFEILEKHSIGYLFYIGGNDSMDTVAKLSAYSREMSLGVSVIGIPKTIDNDLALTDHTPGYGSASKYVATTVYEISRDISAYKLPSVTIVEIMGRDAGWLGCSCALSKACFGKGADLIYLPEGEFSLDSFLGDIENKLRAKNDVLACVCEGVNVGTRGTGKDPFGHIQLSGVGKLLEGKVKENMGCKARSVELNLPQRCAGHLLSATDIEESVLAGRYAVELALSRSGKMVAFERKSGEYGIDVTSVDAYRVANKIKHVPRDFIDFKNSFITQKGVDYALPLIKGEKNVKYVMGMPHHFEIEEYLCTK